MLSLRSCRGCTGVRAAHLVHSLRRAADSAEAVAEEQPVEAAAPAEGAEAPAEEAAPEAAAPVEEEIKVCPFSGTKLISAGSRQRI